MEEHSRLNRFGVLKKTSKERGCEYARYVSFACDKSRKPTAKNYSKMVDCKCKVNCVVFALMVNVVTSDSDEHNHELQPSLARFFGCHRGISKALKRNLEPMTSQELDLPKALDFWKYKQVVQIECDAHLKTVETTFFNNMKDNDFFYIIDTDNVGRLRNVVWVHTHCKYAYREFSDVVCFDLTYLVN
ncbi:hypothetical protein H5410_007272 [Solanum commersonii]|uniref:Protein FAR1-RELATED SEQUENCE n=1 Tax=Solanum commersonii TaxID=4109 RepID=A0A9J6ABH7_SOLCO|nr:hypothetical protein H5410_007272 [Solanum commersonii]